MDDRGINDDHFVAVDVVRIPSSIYHNWKWNIEFAKVRRLLLRLGLLWDVPNSFYFPSVLMQILFKKTLKLEKKDEYMR